MTRASVRDLLARHLADADRPDADRVTIGALTPDGERHLLGDGTAVYRIASLSKMFTGLALGAAVSRGDVALDEVVPEAPAHPDGTPVRLVHLATHTSGLRNEDFPGDDGTQASFRAAVARMVPRSRPGETFAYCNWGAALLANLLGWRAGLDGADPLLEREVCGPLGLADTRPAPADARLAARLRTAPDGPPTPVLPTGTGAGGLLSTADDLLTLLAAQLGGRDVPAPLAAAAGLVREPRVPRGDGGSVGLCWLVDGRTVWHNGALPGYRTWAGYDRGTGCALVILTTSTLTVDPLAHPLLTALTKHP